MKIAIIGAGPSGLATAKALRDVGLSPVIFEASSCLGGIWAPANKRLWKSLHTNLSKYTCCFSDLPWSQETTQMFPSSQQVHEYLTRYADQYIPAQSFRFNTKITQLKTLTNGKFRLSWLTSNPSTTSILKSNDEKEESDEFEKVVIASGYFAAPNSMDHNNTGKIASLSSLGSSELKFQGKEYFPGNIYYSHEYQDPERFRDKEVIVVGGSFSGCEIAAEISTIAKKVYHIIPSYTHVLPRYIPLNPQSKSTSFLPIDLVFYSLPGEKQDRLNSLSSTAHSTLSTTCLETLFKTSVDAQRTKGYLQSLIGNSEFTDPLYGCREIDAASERQASVAISDRYKAMVRCGAIDIIPGRLKSVSSNGHLFIQPIKKQLESMDLEDITEQRKLHEVKDLIFCTGFTTNVEDFVDHSLLQNTLNYESSHPISPLQLYHEILHPNIPHLYFVGMYKGPYFGVIEMQAVSFINIFCLLILRIFNLPLLMRVEIGGQVCF